MKPSTKADSPPAPKSKATFPIRIGDKEYSFSPPNERMLNEFTQWVLATRQSPLDLIRDRLDFFSLEQQRMMIAEAIAQETKINPNMVSPEELEFAADSRQGSAKLFYLMLRQNHPEVSEEEFIKLIEEMEDDAFERVMQARNAIPTTSEGEDELSDEVEDETESESGPVIQLDEPHIEEYYPDTL